MRLRTSFSESPHMAIQSTKAQSSLAKFLVAEAAHGPRNRCEFLQRRQDNDEPTANLATP